MEKFNSKLWRRKNISHLETYNLIWRHKHPKHVHLYAKRYLINHRHQHNQACLKWNHDHPEAIKRYQAKYHQRLKATIEE